MNKRLKILVAVGLMQSVFLINTLHSRQPGSYRCYKQQEQCTRDDRCQGFFYTGSDACTMLCHGLGSIVPLSYTIQIADCTPIE